MADEELLQSLRERIEELDLFKVKDEITSEKEISIFLMNKNIEQLYYYIYKGGFSGNPPILEILVYLFNVEGVLTYCVDIIIYYLIKYEHHNICLDRKKKIFVSEFDELSEVHLNQKILFLEKNGFNNLSTLFNRDFRNAIAHLSFFSSPTHQSPKSVVQYYQSKRKKREITDITLEDIVKWNLNIGMFHRYFNNQFLRVA